MPPRERKGAARRVVEDLFLSQVRAAGYPEPEREVMFHEPAPGEKKRRWRFDFAWPPERIAVEVDGGVWNGGRHVRPAGFEADREKYGTALALGWHVLAVTTRMVKNGLGIELFKRVWQTFATQEPQCA